MTAPLTIPAERPARRPEQRAGLALANLFNGPDELARHLVACVEREDALDAFLLAAGLLQIAEDVLEREHLRLADAHRVLADGGRATAARGVAAAATALARLPRGSGAVRQHAAAVASLVDELADMVVAEGPHEWGSLARRARAIRDDLPSVAALQAGVLRLPACFRGFDQHPRDIERLTEALTAIRPDREAPVAIVGVRTSGSYLAPLTAACLRARGYAGAFALTARPSHPLDAPKRRRLRELAQARGAFVVTDDPPASGDSIRRVIRALEALGAPLHSTVAMFATQAGAEPPPALEPYECVTLPWQRWSIHERLAPAAIGRALARLWPDAEVGTVVRVPLVDDHARGHVAARYRVVVEAPIQETRDVLVRGAGLGYFGEHAAAVADRLREWVPELHGVVDGLAFRDWIPTGVRERPRAADVAAYVAERAERMPVERDASELLGGQDPVWEVASNILSRAFARGWRAARLSALDAMVRELLAPERLSVIDGRMGPDAWYAGPVKAKADEGAFSNRNLACADPAYDLAAAAALCELEPDELRAAYVGAADAAIDGERWLLYQLVAAWAARRDGSWTRADERHASARALRRYLASLFVDDLRRGDRAFCALDVDGVLETETLGFPGPTPAGALALRALLAHGYRPLLASGRSIGEIRDRCGDYGLAGGVAEYGAALFDAARGEVEVLVTADGAAAVERARTTLAERPGIDLGGDHLHTIRAWRRDGEGRRVPLTVSDVRAALDAAGAGLLRTVPGECQTDFVPEGVDKARGLRALTASLGEPGAAIELAVGDAVEDIPMLELAHLGLAPANADAAVRARGVRRTRRGYQPGLAQAVGELIGHAPGDCPACAAPEIDRRTGMLLGVLGAQEGGTARLAQQALRTARQVRRPRAGG